MSLEELVRLANQGRGMARVKKEQPAGRLARRTMAVKGKGLLALLRSMPAPRTAGLRNCP